MKNINNGYIGYSMSIRASLAYDQGEKPRSKFNKQDLQFLQNRIKNEYPFFYETSLKIKVKDFKNYLGLLFDSTPHHTSKFFNYTDFFDPETEFKKDDLISFLKKCGFLQKKHNFTPFYEKKESYYCKLQAIYKNRLKSNSLVNITFDKIIKYNIYYYFNNFCINSKVKTILEIKDLKLKRLGLYYFYINNSSNSEATNSIIKSKIHLKYKIFLFKKLFKLRYKIRQSDNHNQVRIFKYLKTKGCKFDPKKLIKYNV